VKQKKKKHTTEAKPYEVRNCAQIRFIIMLTKEMKTKFSLGQQKIT